MENDTLASNGTNGGDDSVANASLLVSAAALAVGLTLVIAQLVFQVLFSYVSSSTARSKTNTAALGEWHRYTKPQSWRFWRGKLHISYGMIELTQESLWKNLLAQEITPIRELMESGFDMNSYRVKYGDQYDGKEVVLFRKSDDSSVSPSELNAKERGAWEKFQQAEERRTDPLERAYASYTMLARDLQFDLNHIKKPNLRENADLIPAACSAPLLCIRKSDLIVFSYILDMDLFVDTQNGEFTAKGEYCQIFWERVPNVGVVYRYDIKAREFSSPMNMTNARESKMLAKLASGTVGLGEMNATMMFFGYNSINYMMDHWLQRSSECGWQEMSTSPNSRMICEDQDGRWRGRWSQPMTPRIAFLMAIISSPAVAKAFPHIYLSQWGKGQYGLCSRTEAAIAALTKVGYGPETPPETFISSIFQNHSIKSSSYKVADNFGCEMAGLRSYMGANLAKFTEMVAVSWPWETPFTPDTKPPVPILSELLHHFVSGSSLTMWAATHSGEKFEEHWKLTARAALWLQITMLDSWIGPMIDRLMGESAMREVPVPATQEEAKACAEAAASLPQTMAFNPGRAKWLKLYLQRLAEGCAGRCEGDSFMSYRRYSALEARWVDMPQGTPEEWLVLDAVLTLRAATMYSMLMTLDDSSILLELARSDPLLYMS